MQNEGQLSSRCLGLQWESHEVAKGVARACLAHRKAPQMVAAKAVLEHDGGDQQKMSCGTQPLPSDSGRKRRGKSSWKTRTGWRAASVLRGLFYVGCSGASYVLIPTSICLPTPQPSQAGPEAVPGGLDTRCSHRDPLWMHCL